MFFADTVKVPVTAAITAASTTDGTEGTCIDSAAADSSAVSGRLSVRVR